MMGGVDLLQLIPEMGLFLDLAAKSLQKYDLQNNTHFSNIDFHLILDPCSSAILCLSHHVSPDMRHVESAI